MAPRICSSQLLAFIFSCFSVASSLNFSSPAVFNFGDSNSDTGGVVAGVAFPIGLWNGQTYFQAPSGRFCDGRVIIDFLMDAMDHPFLNPYLDSLGAPSFRTGCNFATGGATILPANAAARNPFSFNVQVGHFSRFKARVLQILAKDEKLEEYLPSEDSFKQGLYMFDVGQNDLDGAFDSKTEDQVIAFIPTILSQFEAGVQRLYNEGARNFWVHNTGPLGCLARIITAFGADSAKLDQLGCVKSHNNAANTFNQQLRDLCTKFQDQFPEANVIYVDIFSIKSDLISNSSRYGFKESLAACCGYGGPPLNFDIRVPCGQTKNLNGSTVTGTPCNNTAEYVNWDGTHYTEAANNHIAAKILTGNYSYTPRPANLQIPSAPSSIY